MLSKPVMAGGEPAILEYCQQAPDSFDLRPVTRINRGTLLARSRTCPTLSSEPVSTLARPSFPAEAGCSTKRAVGRQA